MASSPGLLRLLMAFQLLFAPALIRACGQEFTCSQGWCVPPDHVCDFRNDCEDGHDEEYCSRYTRCDFEESFCDMTQSPETSGWVRTNQAPGLKHDHMGRSSAHFLSLSPVRGNKTTADLKSPVFLPSQTCQVLIRGELSAQSEASNVLAVDDLSFSPGCSAPTDISSTPPSLCPDSWFACGDGECIEESRVCDFTPHCLHGEDEAGCPTVCDFDDGSCGWFELTPGDGFDWVRGTSAEVPPHFYGYPPPLDHTTSSTEGHFMFILKNSSSLYPQAVLQGPWFRQSASGCTMTFWHYNSGISVGAANMNLRIKGDPNNTVIWRTLYDQGPQWKQTTVQLGRLTQPFQISLSKISLGVFDGVSALDDVTFSNCSMPPAVAHCPKQTHFHCTHSKACVESLRLCDLLDDCGDGSDEDGCSPELQCNFEEGLCSWTQEQSGGDVFDWTRIQGPTPTFNTGPWKDHTLGTISGHYLYIESSEPQQFKDTAVLLSRLFQPTVQRSKDPSSAHCVFRFHYHMFGSHVFCLAVYMRTTATGRGSVLWVQYGNQGNMWHRKTLYLSSSKPFQILIEGTVGDDFKGDIAIDDLSFLDCEPYEVREQCTFEGGETCGWKTVDSSVVDAHAFRWSPNQGESTHDLEQYQRPINDHTLGTPEGWYLCADSSNGGYGHITDLQTPVIASTGAQCILVFWYYMNGFTVGTLQVP
ncbi:unnamed protein product [Tetraodon nigroviridis]|uniref:(spotted green pufferfish) hypothetical protein n=1 Tax=Tetraodon nigroviridis TaxID=99883 RepID=Q4SXP5_TETNG|nr:unnamed protein product [Tetraodon nigroviridis]